MAKSIRSKSKRRVRAIKRERLAPRILKRLQTTVSNLDDNKIKMEADNSDLVDDSNIQFSTMETDSERLNLKTKRRRGSYPIWLTQRKIKKKELLNQRKIKKKKRDQRIKNARKGKAQRIH
ncbi:unnamed protein product [Cercopithifilaria johnstoni]|uniref:Uncharacterized protein n=1 Tax=Cercopithifilaria johnstoni TaxID=2874296 RepID=A0A8J2LSJ6_9BILA|nr:unnamed protein product [Cercopithifilaria johnstoni]